MRFEKGKALDRDLAPLEPVRRKKAVVRVGPESEGTVPGDAEEEERARPDRPTDPPLRG